MSLQLHVALPRERVILENLFQLYVHDFSEHWAGTERGELDEDGRFEPYRLDPYWVDEGFVPLLLRHDRNLVGFALLNRAGHAGREVDHNVAEFFVVRKHRRAGIGRAAVAAIFDRYPGQWETAVARRNEAATAFWRRAIGSHPRARDVEERDLRSTAWNGPLFRFRIG